MSQNRFLTVPNVLTTLATLCAVAVLWRGGFDNQLGGLGGATAFLLWGSLFCILDGMIAEKWNQVTEIGEDVLQPVAGLFLSVSSVVVLCWHHYWSWLWAATPLALVMLVLQGVSNRAKRSPGRFLRLKRFQFAAQPIMTNAVIAVAAIYMLVVTSPHRFATSIVGWGLAGCVALVLLRRERFEYWFAGPKWKRLKI